MAHKKAGGSTRNGRDSESKRLEEPRGAFSDPFGSGHGLDHHKLAAQRTLGFELNATGFLGKDGVVFAHAGIHASVEFGATLTNNDFACADNLAAEAFHAKAFTFRIATVTSTTTSPWPDPKGSEKAPRGSCPRGFFVSGCLQAICITPQETDLRRCGERPACCSTMASIQ